MPKSICKYRLDLRGCFLEGAFILTDEEIEKIKSLENYLVYYGEVAGKYSSVERELKFEDIKIVAQNILDVYAFEHLFPNGIGFKFNKYWFDTEDAFGSGYTSAEEYTYATPEEALKESFENYNNSI